MHPLSFAHILIAPVWFRFLTVSVSACSLLSFFQIFTADIIYHLFDSCTKYMAEVRERKRNESVAAVFPCVLDILPNSIFNVKSPIVLGVRVVEGFALIGTPICIPSKDFLVIGGHSEEPHGSEAKKGEEFALKIEQDKGAQQIVFGHQPDAQLPKFVLVFDIIPYNSHILNFETVGIGLNSTAKTTSQSAGNPMGQLRQRSCSNSHSRGASTHVSLRCLLWKFVFVIFLRQCALLREEENGIKESRKRDGLR